MSADIGEDPHGAALVACPKCKQAGGLIEQNLRYTFQPVHGLRRDGDADDYDSFDYGDDVVVTGYSCRCGWYDAFDLSAREMARLGRHADTVLARMPREVST